MMLGGITYCICILVPVFMNTVNMLLINMSDSNDTL